MMDKLLYMSKSKVGTFRTCPFQFKLSYIDKLQQASNPYYETGTDVHAYHEYFFDAVKIVNNQLIVPKLEHNGTNGIPKRHISRFYINKFKYLLIHKPENPAKYFFPILKEKKIVLDDLGLVGVPDAVELNMEDKPVVVELKTGKPNKKKIDTYKNDLVWYKLLVEKAYPEFGPVNEGKIYFADVPEVYISDYNHGLCKDDVDALFLVIDNVRAQIVEKNFDPTPTPNGCTWCGYRKHCDARWN